jgi:glutamyl-Q tRNA(Asp) synthetase
MRLTTRFAPSPTGFLHLGHAFAALTAWRRAREAGGIFLVRLEDIDPGRCRPHFSDAILEDLTWLGLDWDGEVRLQSEHMADYRAVLDTLSVRGFLYPCFCTRADIAAAAAAPHDPDDGPGYPGTCRALSRDQRAARIATGAAYALRLDVARASAEVGPLDYEEHGSRIVCRPARFGDVALARKDTPCSYHLCVTHDDARQGVTLVTRGTDLQAATDVQRLLQALMGWPAPSYAHHALRTDASGRRLAKRDQAATLRDLRARGVSPAEVRAMADGGPLPMQSGEVSGAADEGDHR